MATKRPPTGWKLAMETVSAFRAIYRTRDNAKRLREIASAMLTSVAEKDRGDYNEVIVASDKQLRRLLPGEAEGAPYALAHSATVVLRAVLDQKMPEPIEARSVAAASRISPPAPFKDVEPRNNLPEQTSSFVGRDIDLNQIVSQMDQVRLLTLTGSGGVGKTRLVLKVATEVLEAFPGGAWFVEFASLKDPALVPQLVAGALGEAEEAGRPLVETLIDRLRTSPSLLILDNCEHLIEATACLADVLLRSVPTLRLLATSREPLNVGGEAVRRVPSLEIPEPSEQVTPASLCRYESVRLFVERARAQKHGFAVTEANAAAVASLCSRLDGIPLAIELAAARIGSLTVELIEKSLSDRFRLLTRGLRTVLPRQQTLRASIDWSYDLLNEQERRVFRHVASFAGGWTLEAAQAVAGNEEAGKWTTMDLMSSLVAKSLVTVEEDRGATRYGMLESVRAYAQERLDESDDETGIHARHATFFTSLAVEKGWASMQFGDVMHQLHADEDNLRVALDRGTRTQRLRMAGRLEGFWSARGTYKEGYEQCRRALRDDEPPSLDSDRWRALKAAGWLSLQEGDFAACVPWCEEAYALARHLGNPVHESASLAILAASTWLSGELVRARALHEKVLLIQDRAPVLVNLAGVHLDLGDFARADATLKRCWGLLRENPGDYDLHHYHRVRGNLEYRQGNTAAALASYAVAQRLAVSLESKELISGLKVDVCDCLRAEGDLEKSLELAVEAVSETSHAEGREASFIALARASVALGSVERARTAMLGYIKSHTPLHLPQGLETAASVLARVGNARVAAVLIGSASASRLHRPMPLPPVDVAGHEALVLAVRETLGDEEFDSARDEGESMALATSKAFASQALA